MSGTDLSGAELAAADLPRASLFDARPADARRRAGPDPRRVRSQRGSQGPARGSKAFDACLSGLAVVPLLLLVLTSTPSLAGFLGVAICFLCLFQVIRCSREPDAGPIGIGFYGFVGVWAGLGSVVQIAVGQLPWSDFARVDLFPAAQGLTLLAVACHMLGRKLDRLLLRRRSRAARPERRRPAQPRPWRAILVIAALAAPGILLTGGLDARFTSRSEFTDVLAAQGISYDGGQSVQLGLLRILPSATSLVAVYLAVLAWRLRRSAGLPVRMSDRLAVAVALGAAAVFANPLSASRFNAFSVALAVLFALVPLTTFRAKVAFGLLLCVGLIVVYPLAAWFKRPPGAIDLPEIGTESLLTIDYDGFQQVINSIQYVERDGYSDGRFTLSAALFWVPRSTWPDKELPASFAVSDVRNYPARNLSLPLWAELYMEFTVVGSALGMVAVGLVGQRLDRALRADPGGRLAGLGGVLAATEVGFLRGPMGAQVPFFACALGLVALSYGRPALRTEEGNGSGTISRREQA